MDFILREEHVTVEELMTPWPSVRLSLRYKNKVSDDLYYKRCILQKEIKN